MKFLGLVLIAIRDLAPAQASFQSMKVFFVVLSLALPISTFADCLNFSYKMPYFSAELRAKQVGCEKLVYQQFFQGESVGDAWEVTLSDTFTVDRVDDEYESFDRWDRRYISLDGKALIHENIVDSVKKSDGSKVFTSLIETIYFGTDGKLRLRKFNLRREMKRDQFPDVKSTSEEIELGINS